MLKIKIVLRASTDMKNLGYVEGDTCTLINDVFDPKIGIAYFPIDKRWEVVKLELIQFESIDIIQGEPHI